MFVNWESPKNHQKTPLYAPLYSSPQFYYKYDNVGYQIVRISLGKPIIKKYGRIWKVRYLKDKNSLYFRNNTPLLVSSNNNQLMLVRLNTKVCYFPSPHTFKLLYLKDKNTYTGKGFGRMITPYIKKMGRVSGYV